MLAVVKTHRTDRKLFQLSGQIPKWLVKELEGRYGDRFEVEDDDQYVNAKETAWYKNLDATMGPGDYLRTYRETRGLSQAKLGQRLGGIPRQHVSNMEKGHRGISVKVAQRLAKIFDVPVERFLPADEDHSSRVA